MDKEILFVPSVLPSGGWGHLSRCWEAAQAVNGLLWAPEGRPPQVPPQLWFDGDPAICKWKLVVFDRRRTEQDLFQRFSNGPQPLVGWDEGGTCRSRMDYLVDSLGNTSHTPPNRKDPGLMDLGKHRPYEARPIRRVLLAFGGNDQYGLAPRVLEALDRLPDTHWELTVLEGPWQDRQALPTVHGRRPQILSRPQRLRDHLRHYDLVFCSYGLTAHECLNQGVPFLTVEPTAYHAQLSRKQSWPLLGIRGVRLSRLTVLLQQIQDPLKLVQLYPQFELDGPPHALWTQFRRLDRCCAACGSTISKVERRLEDRTYYRCLRCGFRFQKPWLVPEKVYGPDYFETEYRNQYGRTYLQDFEHIEAMGLRRLSLLESLSGNLGGRRLLDLGCAFGPFLSAGLKKAMLVEGVDINPQAVDWVQHELGVPAACRSVGEAAWELSWPQGSFDVVSLWYVIEHLPHLDQLLRGLRYLLRPGGWLLLATPNAAGLTARLHPDRFYRESPADHFTLWEPTTSRRLLARYGFRVRRIEPTGIHPDRLLGRSLGPHLSKWVAAMQRLLGWGDTMELYSRREP